MFEEEHLVLGVRYIHKSDHRDGTQKKSQWIISREAERFCFSQSQLFIDQSKVPELETKTRWGLHFEAKQVAYLGDSKHENPPVHPLFIAKFVNDKQHDY